MSILRYIYRDFRYMRNLYAILCHIVCLLFSSGDIISISRFKCVKSTKININLYPSQDTLAFSALSTEFPASFGKVKY